MPETSGKGRGNLTGHWPPLSKGYWELRKRASLQALDVSLQGFQPPVIQVPVSGVSMPGRLLPLLHVASVAAWRLQSIQAVQRFSIQLHDEDPGRDNCLRFDADARSTEVLLPDPYALGSNGYQQIRSQFHDMRLPTWKERARIAFWRGTTTGNPALTLKRLSNSMRYSLCSFRRETNRSSSGAGCKSSSTNSTTSDANKTTGQSLPRLDVWATSLFD